MHGQIKTSGHRRNNRRDRGRLVPQLLDWDQQCIGSPNFLAVIFKKQEISQQVVTRMQDLAPEFSKICRRWYPWTLRAGGGDPLPHPTPSLVFRCWDPNLGPPQLFSRGCTPASGGTFSYLSPMMLTIKNNEKDKR